MTYLYITVAFTGKKKGKPGTCFASMSQAVVVQGGVRGESAGFRSSPESAHWAGRNSQT